MNQITSPSPVASPTFDRLQNRASEIAKDAGKPVSIDEHNQMIEEASKEFESVFLSLVLKEMRNTLDQDNGGLFAGENTDTLGGMFDLFMSQHLSKGQPLGIADSIKLYVDSAGSAKGLEAE